MDKPMERLSECLVLLLYTSSGEFSHPPRQFLIRHTIVLAVVLCQVTSNRVWDLLPSWHLGD